MDFHAYLTLCKHSFCSIEFHIMEFQSSNHMEKLNKSSWRKTTLLENTLVILSLHNVNTALNPEFNCNWPMTYPMFSLIMLMDAILFKTRVFCLIHYLDRILLVTKFNRNTTLATKCIELGSDVELQ